MATATRSRAGALRWVAAVGDAAILLVLTLLGFVTHATADAVPRLALTWGTAVVAWAWVAPWFGAFDAGTLTDPRRVWRVAWAWSVAAPLAVFLRAAALDRDVSWVFTAVTVLVNGLVMVAWRAGFAWFGGRSSGFGWGPKRP